ncbi:MAG: hypothetical protein WCR48_07690, partial [Bacteroidales bacterium]
MASKLLPKICIAVILSLFAQALTAQTNSTTGSQQFYDVDIDLTSATVKTTTQLITKQTGVVFSYESPLASKSL